MSRQPSPLGIAIQVPKKPKAQGTPPFQLTPRTADRSSMLAQFLLKDGLPNGDFLEALADLTPEKQRVGLASDLIELVNDWIRNHPESRNLNPLVDEVRAVIQDACCACSQSDE